MLKNLFDRTVSDFYFLIGSKIFLLGILASVVGSAYLSVWIESSVGYINSYWFFVGSILCITVVSIVIMAYALVYLDTPLRKEYVQQKYNTR